MLTAHRGPSGLADHVAAALSRMTLGFTLQGVRRAFRCHLAREVRRDRSRRPNERPELRLTAIAWPTG